HRDCAHPLTVAMRLVEFGCGPWAALGIYRTFPPIGWNEPAQAVSRLVRTSAAICPLKESGSQRRAPERSRARRQPARAGQSRGRSRLAAQSGWTPSQTRKKIRGPVNRGTGWGARQQPGEELRTQRAQGLMGLSEGAA